MTSTTANLTLFAIPKPMVGEAARLQHNAFESWKRLRESVQVIICGDEEGIEEAATQYGFDYLPVNSRNDQGTPLLNSCFAQVRNASARNLLAYVNADIILGPDFLCTVDHLFALPINRFLGIGQRWESQLEQRIDSWSDEELNQWIQAQRKGPTASVVCKDYFIFPRHLFQELPAFAVGRGNWDNWMVYHANRSGIPVLDLTDSITAVHQPHGHSHCGGRLRAYVAGQEAKRNKQLAGGTHLFIGSHATHRLSADGQLRTQGWRTLTRAIKDVPRFVQLLTTFRNVAVKTNPSEP